jgi:hypothetical protein
MRQIDACLANQIAAKLDAEMRSRPEPAGQRSSKLLASFRAHQRKIERLVAREIGNARTRHPGCSAAAPRRLLSRQPRGKRQRLRLGVGNGGGIERLAAGEDVKAAPLRPALDDPAGKRGHALGIEPERLGAAAHLHARTLEIEIGVDPDRQARPLAEPFAMASARSPRLRIQD